jgi:drug/metabolite transporter (DMT)-like permease
VKQKTTLLPTLSFLVLGTLWGSNFIYMKLASELISTTQIVIYRVLFGFLPVLAYALFTGSLSWQHKKHLPHFIAMSFMATSIYYYAFAKGATLLLSGVAGAASGAVPIFSFLLAVIFIKEERATKLKVLGVFTAFIGVLIMGRPSGQELSTTNLLGVIYMAVGSLSVGASFVYAKKYIIPLKLPAAALVTYQLGAALLTLSIITDFSGIGNVFTDFKAATGVVVGLGILGTGMAFLIYYYIVRTMGVIAASSVTYIPPVVAVLIGALVVGEPILFLDYVATLFILLGVILLKRES